MKTTKRLMLCFIVVAFLNSPGFAAATLRVVKILPYKEMLKKADLVVIAQVLEIEDLEENDKGWDKKQFVRMKATLTVRSVLKGGKNLKTIDFIYYRRRKRASEKLEIQQGLRGKVIVEYVPGSSGTGSGSFLRLKKLRTSKNSDRVEKEAMDDFLEMMEPTYLFYLKKRPDGNYEPLLGQKEPIFSVKELAFSATF